MYKTYEELQMAVRAAWPGRIILTAVELKIADVLAKGADEGLTASAVAAELSADERATSMFLDALSSLGLAKKKDDKYKKL